MTSVNANIKISAVLIRLSIFAFLCGCSYSLDEYEVYGTYIVDYEVASEKLILNKDKTYIQEVTLKETSKVDKVIGTWTYSSDDHVITFHENFINVWDFSKKIIPDYSHPKPHVVIYPVKKIFGKVQIGSSEYIIYKKVKEGSTK